MCFSLKASLSASALLFIAGFLCIKKSQNKILAYIPFFFAIQQFAEALVWASFDFNWDEKWIYIFSYLFLFFAYIVWPSLIPYSFLQMELKKKRQQFLKILFYVGIMVSTYLTYELINYPLNVKIVCSSIEYFSQSASDNIYLLLLYAFTVIVPCFISTISHAKIFGIALFISWATSCLVYSYAFTSIWCFFAAILSSMIYFLL